MNTLLICVGSLSLLLLAYWTYGRWLSRRLFELSEVAPVPSKSLRDDQDFVPTPKGVVFGHHFTSIAGTGPIVGPALAVFWGWLPALAWVVFGAILIGGVHDLSALIISMRNRGQTIGEIAGRMISKRARLLFLTILALALWIVLAIFGLVIAQIFNMYPESVLSVWMAMPLAVVLGLWAHHLRRSLFLPSLVSLAILYAAVYVGVYYLPIRLTMVDQGGYWNPVVLWTLFLLLSCFLASVLPVWLLLQPRDLVNSHQLLVAMALLVGGLLVASLGGQADIFAATDAVATQVPSDALPIFPFLFITIACGACSGFHCLVSSGTSSKQISNEKDAHLVGYGSMLLESGLAVMVILACTAGVGMGVLEKKSAAGSSSQASLVGALGSSDLGSSDLGASRLGSALSVPEPDSAYRYRTDGQGQPIIGRQAWNHYYRIAEDGTGWAAAGSLDVVLRAFIEGGANFMGALGVPLELGIGIVAVLVACFAATTLDTATRLQRYVIQEVSVSFGMGVQNKYVATGLAVGVAGAIAVFAGDPPGSGGRLLWPLFGATNQLLAGLALMVATFYLWRRNKIVAVVAIPGLVMLLIPGWAMTYSLVYFWIPARNWVLIAFGSCILLLQLWMVVEAVLLWKNARGVLEPQLEPLPIVPSQAGGA
jgi:carbon starvation protein